MSNYKDCIKRKYKKPIFLKCKELGLEVESSMSIEELCKIYHNYFDKNKESLSKQSPKKIQIFPKIIIDKNYKRYKTNELISLCKKRGLTLRSFTRSYLIERLEKEDKKQSSEKSSEVQSSSEKSSEVQSSEKSSEKYQTYSVKELKSLCRERKIPLKSYKKEFMIQKLEKYEKEKSSLPKEIEKEKSLPKEIEKEKSFSSKLFGEGKFNELAKYIKECYI